MALLALPVQLLTDVPILVRMKEAFAGKGERILKFFQEKPTNDEVRSVLSMYAECEDNSKAACVVLLLMAHFKEKGDALFLQADVSFWGFIYSIILYTIDLHSTLLKNLFGIC